MYSKVISYTHTIYIYILICKPFFKPLLKTWSNERTCLSLAIDVNWETKAISIQNLVQLLFQHIQIKDLLFPFWGATNMYFLQSIKRVETKRQILLKALGRDSQEMLIIYVPMEPEMKAGCTLVWKMCVIIHHPRQK